LSDVLQVALSHDIDRVHKTYQYLTRAFRSCMRMRFGAALKEILSVKESRSVYWNFEDIMETEDKHGVRSTFFFLNESIRFQLLRPSNWKLSLGRYDVSDPKITDVIQQLDKNGWEVGLHGSYLSYNNYDLLVREKRILEDIVGHEVVGIRQHYLNWNDHTWEYQYAAGFKYDSSLGYNDRVGYYDDIAKPFKHRVGLIEFPLAIMDICYMKIKDRSEALTRVIKQTKKAQGVLVLNWHGDNWDDHDYPEYKKTYIGLINFLQDQGAVFKTLGDFYHDYNEIDMPIMTIRK
jgi:peptidoglycan/xylan/chitin deacetylase (PgdA/CDA1 family)